MFEFKPRSTASSNLRDALQDGDITIEKTAPSFNPVSPGKEATQIWNDRTVIGYQQYSKVSYTIVRSGVEKILEFKLQPQSNTEWKPFIDEDKASNAETTPIIKIKTEYAHIFDANQLPRNLQSIYWIYLNYTVTFNESPLVLRTSHSSKTSI